MTEREKRGLICLSLAGETADALIRQAEPLVHLADLAELRLDAMKRPDIAPFIARFDIPVLATNRPTWEGGAFSGSESERLAVLEAALDAGARYVDIELRTEPALRDAFLEKARERGAWSIVSWHDFHETPDVARLSEIYREMRDLAAHGAKSGKIVTFARNNAEALRTLALLQQADADFPLSAFAMGEPGGITRLAALHLGGHICYAAADEDSGTAPGQLGIRRLRALCDLLPA